MIYLFPRTPCSSESTGVGGVGDVGMNIDGGDLLQNCVEGYIPICEVPT